MNITLNRNRRIKILVRGHSNIGDVCYDLALIQPLKRHFPQSHITFLSHSKSSELAEGYPGVDKVMIFKRKGQHRFFNNIQLTLQLNRERFDLSIGLVKSFRHRFSFILHDWNIAKMLKQELRNKQIHPLDIYAKFLEKKNVHFETSSYTFSRQDADQYCDRIFKKYGLDPKAPLVGILPFSAWRHKDWETEKWNEFAVRLKKDFNLQTIAFGKIAETSLLKSLSPIIISEINQTTLKQAIALTSRCRIFVGPDSSLLHYASCLHTDTIGLYGPTSANYMYPYFHRENIVHAKIKNNDRCCGAGQFECPRSLYNAPCLSMKKIGVDEVVLQVEKILTKAGDLTHRDI